MLNAYAHYSILPAARYTELAIIGAQRMAQTRRMGMQSGRAQLPKSAEVFALPFFGIAGAPGCAEAPMTETRRMGMQSGRAQLPKAPRFSPYRHTPLAALCSL
jgi:hypothetical protein